MSNWPPQFSLIVFSFLDLQPKKPNTTTKVKSAHSFELGLLLRHGIKATLIHSVCFQFPLVHHIHVFQYFTSFHYRIDHKETVFNSR